MESPLVARGVRKRYGDTRALDGLDLEIAPGTVHALLGPNGAGKSTAVRTFATLTRYDEGEVRVAGHDVRRDGAAVRRAIGLVGQSPALDDVLHGRENLVLLGRLHGLPARAARGRADELLAAYGLAEAGGRPVSTYSGGMRRRLDIAASLIRRPSLLFLDEPTTGLDPRGRSEVWATVRQVVAQGTTVLLTTQYLDEADQLADRITVMGSGRVIAEGTSAELKDRLGGDRVIVTVAGDDLDVVARVLDAPADRETRQVTVEAGAQGGTAALLAAVRALDAAGLAVDDVLLRRPTLDEVFLHLTEGAAR
ncbi:ATP-binding cassette domain-containing protein [Nocardioides sp. LMS-CY]|uniref:ABC transporter ATP-binding protein n=1 Tax=Nocardioides sp. (strain LMS-CY) TaxID=2840457 RepID=UPI001C006B32|nr:ATP-binding cassette domain-containing protein [Nocardioides sp. LMS-CY]QWF23491.1 ATP-binding cassette domain-containing protein [Nocardioides sp. LMS-CY]